ncbi:ribonuclease HII [bacterium]|nr:ribonuclease HII [bacterium]
MSGRAQEQANDLPEVDRQNEAPTRDAARPDSPSSDGSQSDSSDSSDLKVDLSGLSIRSIREMVAGVLPEPGDSLWLAMEADPRKGVLELVEGLSRRRAAEARERRRILEMRRHEMKLWDDGATIVAGVDEVGRGPLAGPVMAAAVVLPREIALDGLNDSKKLTPQRREELFDDIMNTALAVGVGSVSHETIDEINILHATLRAMRDAVHDLGLSPDHVLVDGSHAIPDVETSQTSIQRGDERSAPIAAASIVAKVTRDRMMVEMAEEYPGYGFARHKGYGTPEHIAALTRLGPCSIHRRSFRIVLESAGGFSLKYNQFRRGLKASLTQSDLDAVGSLIAADSDELDPYELTRLRGLYKRCVVRLRTNLTRKR